MKIVVDSTAQEIKDKALAVIKDENATGQQKFEAAMCFLIAWHSQKFKESK